MWVKILLSVILVLNLAGCATMQKKSMADKQVQELQAQVSKLESELQQKNETVRSLGGELEKVSRQTAAQAPSAKEQAASYEKTPKNIQTALKNADLYKGPIDGNIGVNTKKAIKEFQRLNGLTADGIAGKKTWSKLREFLY